MGSQILLVEDEDIIQFALIRYFQKFGIQVKRASTLKKAREAIAIETFDAVILDVKLPDGNSLDLIKEIATSDASIPVIVISGASDVSTAVKAMKLGASNFITKPLEMDALGLSIQKSLELIEFKKKDAQVKRLQETALKEHTGSSTQSLQIKQYAEVTLENNSVVLLLGETGTGKGVLAKWIHENSLFKNGNFVELNCSTLKGDLLRSEMYGHTRGAFTSALKDREGLIEVADKGTLFLDEIGDMELGVQAELLKTIEEKTFRRIGENKTRKSDFRLICATNKNLKMEAESGKFRTDLYYRICVFPIEIPALRERRDDIPGFVKHFLNYYGYDKPLHPSLLQALCNYNWPGNVRELRNTIERAHLLAQGKELRLEHFPGIGPDTEVPHEYNVLSLAEMERTHICRVMEYYNDDIVKASKVLQVSIETLNKKLGVSTIISSHKETAVPA